MANAIVIQDRPLDGTDAGTAEGAIETFDVDVGLGGRSNKVVETVRDASSSTPINQDIKRVGVKDGTMCSGGTRVVAKGLSSSNSHGNCREDHDARAAPAPARRRRPGVSMR